MRERRHRSVLDWLCAMTVGEASVSFPLAYRSCAWHASKRASQDREQLFLIERDRVPTHAARRAGLLDDVRKVGLGHTVGAQRRDLQGPTKLVNPGDALFRRGARDPSEQLGDLVVAAGQVAPPVAGSAGGPAGSPHVWEPG